MNASMSSGKDAASAAHDALDFWFDFSSPYGYFAAHQIDALAQRAGRDAHWHPVLLGAIFKTTGARPLAEIPLKGDYARRDWSRIASLTGIPFAMPTRFPISGVAASRAFIHLRAQNAEQAKRFGLAVYRAYFQQDRSIDEPEVVLAIADELRLDRAALARALQDEPIKRALRDEVADAQARGVFGSPFFIADGEPYFGWDRLPMLDAALHRARRSAPASMHAADAQAVASHAIETEAGAVHTADAMNTDDIGHDDIGHDDIEHDDIEHDDIDIVESLRPGLLGEIVRAHGAYYVAERGWSPTFEAMIAEEIGALAQRCEGGDGDAQFWSAWRGDEFLAAIAIDTAHGLNEGARVRFFIAAAQARGRGCGTRLLKRAVEYCDAHEEPRMWLVTVAGLDAAARVYERAGFKLINERTDTSWGCIVREQRWERRYPASDS